jgi:hypothetical protein
MMTLNFLLLDVAPNPVSTGTGVASLLLIAIAVLMMTGAAVVGFVFLLRSLLRKKAPTNQSLGQATPELQPSSPNQP